MPLEIQYSFASVFDEIAVPFERVPIHIHQVPVLTRNRIVRLKPGIHYAVQTCTDENALRTQLRLSLDANVNGIGLPFAGAQRGRLPDHFLGKITSRFTTAEMDALYEVGINPLVYRYGALMVWGNLFVDGYGSTHRMGDFETGPARRWKPHSTLLNWRSQP
jgi:hypothetical protein